MAKNNSSSPFGDYLNGAGRNLAGNWWDIVLQQMPQAEYYSSPAGLEFAGQSPRNKRYFQQAYQDVYSDYLGNIGTSMRSGRDPQTFDDFMSTDPIGNNPWTSRYASLPQAQRGVSGVYSNPRTRFLYNF